MISEPKHVNDTALDDLVDEVCGKLQAGESVDVEQLAIRFPALADQLRSLFPTLLAINSLEGTHSNEVHSENQTLGDFRILRQIGRGGMGVVYEAQQLSIPRKVALKILPLASLVDHRALQRFKNEVAAIATLNHPHIVSVYAIGEERGIHYFAMQLIHGQSLAAVIKELRSQVERDQRLSGEALAQAVSDIEKQSSDGLSIAGQPSDRGFVDGSPDGKVPVNQSKLATDPLPRPEVPAKPSNLVPAHGLPRLPGPQGRGQRGQGEGAKEVEDDPLDETAVQTVARGRSTTVRQFGDATYFRNVAMLIKQAAEALQHTHDHGIVHRDVKPGNLMLDSSGTLIVTDFGLARIETAAGVTMTGDVLGTLRYMSPEQVQGNRVIVDHRTDVYSLGATLYELLTLQPIWSGEGRAELIRQISSEEPTPPRKINPSISLDLETIILKAVSKNPADRYETAQAFAHDLQCLLDHKPINARRPTMTQRLNKWGHRHPTLVTSAVLILLIVSVGSVISAALILNANNRTRQALTQSEKSLDHVIDAVKRLLWRVGESQLDDVPGTEQLRQELLNDAMEICHSLMDSEVKDPRVQLRAIEALASLGIIQMELDDDASAGKTLTLAISQFKDWIQRHPNHPSVAQAKQSMAGTYVNLGGHYLDLSEYEQASEIFEMVLALEKDLRVTAQQVDSPINQVLRAVAYGKYSKALNGLNKDREACEVCVQAIEILERLVEAAPENATYQVYLGWTYSRLASSHDTLRQQHLAAKNFERAVNILRKWSDKYSNKAWSKSILAGTCSEYALLLTYDDQDKAKALLEESESVFSGLHRQFPDYPDYQSSLANCYEQFGKFKQLLGKHRETIEVLEKSLPLRRDLVQRFSDRPDYRSKLAATLLVYGATLDQVNDRQASEAAHAESIQIFEQLVEEHPRIPDYRFSLVREYYNTGLLLDQQGQPAKADKVLQKAASISERLLNDFPDVLKYRTQLSDVHSARCSCLLTLGRSELALEESEKGTALLQQVVERDPTNSSFQEKLLNLQITQAATRCSLGKFDDALQIFLVALPQYKKRIQQAPGNPLNKSNYSGLLNNIALTYRELGQHALTVRYMEQALDVDHELLVDHPNPSIRLAIANKTEVLLEAYSKIDEPENLSAWLLSAPQDVEDFLQGLDSNELLFKSLVDVSCLIGKLGAYNQSQRLLQKCLHTGQRDFGIGHELSLITANRLGLAQLNLADWKSARENFEQIINIRTNINRNQPENAWNTLMLGGAHCNLGNAESQLNVGALQSYISAIELLEALHQQPKFRNEFLTNSYQGRAEEYRRIRLFDESLADFDRAIDMAADERTKAELRLKRLKTEAQCGNYFQAANLANAIFTEINDEQLAFDVAGVFAIVTAMVDDDQSLDAEERQQNSKTHRDRAFELLEIATSTDLFNNARVFGELSANPDFSAIKADERFNELLSKLEQTEVKK